MNILRKLLFLSYLILCLYPPIDLFLELTPIKAPIDIKNEIYKSTLGVIIDIDEKSNVKNYEIVISEPKRRMQVASGTYLLNGDNTIDLSAIIRNIPLQKVVRSPLLENLGIKSDPIRYNYCFTQKSFFSGTNNKKSDASGNSMRLIFNNRNNIELFSKKECILYQSGTTLETTAGFLLFDKLNQAVNSVGKAYLAENVYADNATLSGSLINYAFSGGKLYLNGKIFQNRIETILDYNQELKISIEPFKRDFLYLFILLLFAWLGVMSQLKKYVPEILKDLNSNFHLHVAMNILLTNLKIRLLRKKYNCIYRDFWSGRRDSNSRPSGPKPDALAN